MTRTVLIVVGLAAALLTAVLLLDQSSKPEPRRASIETQQPGSNDQASPVDSGAVATGSTPKKQDQMAISPTLEDTDIDGALRTSADGRLILDIGVRDFFDYFLSTADEIGAENAIDEVVRYIQTYLPETAQADALLLFENYLRFKRYEFGVHQTPITQTLLNDAEALVLLRENMAKLKAHRQTLFTPKQDTALFGLQDTYAEHTLNSLSVMADDSLSQAQKQAEITRLQQTLPPELQASIQETQDDRARQQTLASQMASNIDDSQLHQSLLEDGIAQQKADEIVDYRQQQRWFEQRYQSYAQARALLDSTDPTFASQLAQLQSQYFITPEQKTQAKLRDLREQ